MSSETSGDVPSQVIGSINNRDNPDQTIDLVYVSEENGFATSGIRTNFDLPEILVPAHLVAQDLQLMGTIVSAILERISRACEKDAVFQYASRFEVMGREYTFTPHGPYMRMDADVPDPGYPDGEVE
ncbi:MAG: hypothetical protein ACQET7_00945 [Thermodesulfobacteriota bacterium]